MQVMFIGDSTEKFVPSRGLRQGDRSPVPLPICPCYGTTFSPYLGDGQSGRLETNQVISLWSPLSHLFFVDDLLLFSKASREQMETVMKCLDSFCEASGIKVSAAKTKVYFSRNIHIFRAQDISNIPGFGVTSDIGHYLGVPLLHSRQTKVTYSHLVEWVRSRLSSWKGQIVVVHRKGHISTICHCGSSYLHDAVHAFA